MKNKKKYQTKKRKMKKFMIKSITLLLVLSFGIALVGNATVRLNEVMDIPNVHIYTQRVEVKEIPELKEITVEEQIKAIAIEKGFKWVDYLIRLARCENDTFDPKRRGDIDKRDRGIFQINSYWHPEVSDECAFDVRCATEWTMWRIESGYQHEWMCDSLI